MRNDNRSGILKAVLALSLAVGLSSCDSDNGTYTPVPSARTFTATITAIELDRTADQQDLVVTDLPAEGATIVVRD